MRAATILFFAASVLGVALTAATPAPAPAQAELPPRCGDNRGLLCRVVRQCTEESCVVVATFYYPVP